MSQVILKKMMVIRNDAKYLRPYSTHNLEKGKDSS